jgi:hypothetical protein
LRTRDIMKRVLPEADVRGYESRIAGLVLPDPNDRHVLVAAIEARAEAILTFNVRHFPAEALAPFGLVARDPDAFLCNLHEADPEAILAAVDAARLNLSRTAPSAEPSSMPLSGSISSALLHACDRVAGEGECSAALPSRQRTRLRA